MARVIACAWVVLGGIIAPLGIASDPPDRRAVQAAGGNELAMMWSRGRGVGSGPVRFTHSPMAAADIAAIIPMGLVVGAHVTPIDHLYFEPKDRTAGRYRYDVRAPADGFVVNIQHRVKLEGSTESEREYDDWRLVIEHSGTFYTYYDLITRVDDAILGAMESERSRPLLYYGRVPVRAGQVIGKIGGRTLDFAAVNAQVRLSGFVVPDHYRREPWKIHTVDPFDYFDEPLRSQLLELNPREAKPRGGKIDFDVDGRLVGNWFLEGTNGYAGAGDPRGYWMGHLAFVYHHIRPDRVIVSIGDFDGRPRSFAVRGNGPDPAEVSDATGLVKYELVPSDLNSSGRARPGGDPQVHGVLLVQLVSDRRIRVEVVPGKSGAEVREFSDGARVYER